MTKQILFLVFFVFSAININAADDVPFPDIPTLPTRPRVIEYNISATPVTVDLSDTDLNLNFTSAEGNAVIMIKNSNGSMIHHELLDTDTDKDLHVSFDNWDSGNYTLIIVNRSKPLKVEFSIRK